MEETLSSLRIKLNMVIKTRGKKTKRYKGEVYVKWLQGITFEKYQKLKKGRVSLHNGEEEVSTEDNAEGNETHEGTEVDLNSEEEGGETNGHLEEQENSPRSDVSSSTETTEGYELDTNLVPTQSYITDMAINSDYLNNEQAELMNKAIETIQNPATDLFDDKNECNKSSLPTPFYLIMEYSNYLGITTSDIQAALLLPKNINWKKIFQDVLEINSLNADVDWVFPKIVTRASRAMGAKRDESNSTIKSRNIPIIMIPFLLQHPYFVDCNSTSRICLDLSYMLNEMETKRSNTDEEYLIMYANLRDNTMRVLNRTQDLLRRSDMAMSILLKLVRSLENTVSDKKKASIDVNRKKRQITQEKTPVTTKKRNITHSKLK